MATAYYRPRRKTERAATTIGHGSQATRAQDMQATDEHGCTRIKLSHAETRRARRRQLNDAAALPLRRPRGARREVTRSADTNDGGVAASLVSADRVTSTQPAQPAARRSRSPALYLCVLSSSAVSA